MSAWLSSTEGKATSRVPEISVGRAGHRGAGTTFQSWEVIAAPNPRLQP